MICTNKAKNIWPNISWKQRGCLSQQYINLVLISKWMGITMDNSRWKRHFLYPTFCIIHLSVLASTHGRVVFFFSFISSLIYFSCCEFRLQNCNPVHGDFVVAPYNCMEICAYTTSTESVVRLSTGARTPLQSAVGHGTCTWWISSHFTKCS